MSSAYRMFGFVASLFIILSFIMLLPRPVSAQTGRGTVTSVCGEACQSDTDCKSSTVTGIQVACRNNKCVNLECHNAGAQTVFGTRCDCNNPVHKCGEECGADIGLCASGLSCTYRSASQCGTEHGVCVPSGTASANRGPMNGVPAYNGSTFQRRACGASTTDPQNNYIYHASFLNHVFTNAEINKYMCNPTLPLSCEVKANNSISLTPLGSTQLTVGVTAKSGTSNVGIKSAKVNFSVSNALASVLPVSDTSQPYQTKVTALKVGNSNVNVSADVVSADNRKVSCQTKVPVEIKKLSCTSTAQCVKEGSGSLESGNYVNCSMTQVSGLTPQGGSISYEGRCQRKLGSTTKETIKLTPVSTNSSAFSRFQVKTGSYHCEFRYCLKDAQGTTACMDWQPGTIK